MITSLEKFQPKELIIAIPEIAGYKKKKVIEMGLQHNLVIKNVPPIDKWINGEFTFNQIKNVNVSDLLGREPMDLENKNIRKCAKRQGSFGNRSSGVHWK